jgi:hypothetical protein
LLKSTLKADWLLFFTCKYKNNYKINCSALFKKTEKDMRWPGIEPGSTAWKAAMLTIIPPTLDDTDILI